MSNNISQEFLFYQAKFWMMNWIDRGFKMGILNPPTNELKRIELGLWISNFQLHSCRQTYTVDLDERFQICIAKYHQSKCNYMDSNYMVTLCPLQIKANEMEAKEKTCHICKGNRSKRNSVLHNMHV